MSSISAVVAAAGSFVGTHLLLSHVLRRPIVGAVGEKVFTGIYSAIALACFAWLVIAFRAAPSGPFLWPVGGGLWAIATVVMLIASILLMGSFVRNPAFPTGGAPATPPAQARGVFAVTRAPMFWSFALWGACHIAVFPVPKNVVVGSSIIILALVGGLLQDAKKRESQPNVWPAWQARTSYWPFAAILAGRARFGGFGGHALGGGLVFWIAVTWAHIPASGWPAGIWRWLE